MSANLHPAIAAALGPFAPPPAAAQPTVWAIGISYLTADRSHIETGWHFHAGTLAEMQELEHLVPAGCEMVGHDVLTVERLRTLRPDLRLKYTLAYRALLHWQVAHRLGKRVEDLQPWVDYDCIHLDEERERWLKGGMVRYAGD